jgi:hypothetical protein
LPAIAAMMTRSEPECSATIPPMPATDESVLISETPPSRPPTRQRVGKPPAASGPQFAADSPLEGTGFEPPVPLANGSVSPREREAPQRRKGQSRRRLSLRA